MKKSIIGKSYIPNDTSYCVNLTYPRRDHRLAGTMTGDNHPKVTKIVSEPYEFLIRRDINKDEAHKHWFIHVEYKGDIVRVLYYKDNVDANLQERMHKLERNQEMLRYLTLI